MYFFLSSAIQRRFILELRRFWSYHPKYRDIVDNIQGRYSFEERPQFGIVLKNSSANNVALSADNFQGTVISYLHLAKVDNFPGLAVEWVREDGMALRANGGEFPSPPGIYYLDITSSNEFYVDPLLDVRDEAAVAVTALEHQLQNPYLEGTLRVYVMPGSLEIYEGTNYTADSSTGVITLSTALGDGEYLSCDYRYPGESTGPHRIYENHGDNTAIPGAVLAFGRRVEKGDKLAVVVHSSRMPTALEYGGKWEMSVDFDVVARDVHAQREIVDSSITYIWGIARNRLSTEGIEIMSISTGGEAEEIYDETEDSYLYTASFSVTTMTDWAIHVPLAANIRRVIPQSLDDASQMAAMTESELASAVQDGSAEVLSHYQMLESMGLRSFEDPHFRDRTRNMEKIS